MQVEKYIKDLLYRYECVIIPGFGAFLTQYKTASITTDHTFIPPGKTLAFNKQLQTNDGLLANYIASVENCSYELALQTVRRFAARLNTTLQTESEVSLDAIGSFKRNAENTFTFSPFNLHNFCVDSFGLDKLTTTVIERKQEIPSTRVIPIEEAAQPFYKKAFKYAAIAVIALSATGIGSLKVYENNVQNHNIAEKEAATKHIENEIQEATFTINNPLPELALTFTKHEGDYHIVAGAFRIEENALKKVAQLQEKGFHPRLIGVNKYGLHQVVYSSHTTRLEALKSLRTIKNTQNKDAWLLVQKLNN